MKIEHLKLIGYMADGGKVRSPDGSVSVGTGVHLVNKFGKETTVSWDQINDLEIYVEPTLDELKAEIYNLKDENHELKVKLDELADAEPKHAVSPIVISGNKSHTYLDDAARAKLLAVLEINKRVDPLIIARMFDISRSNLAKFSATNKLWVSPRNRDINGDDRRTTKLAALYHRVDGVLTIKTKYDVVMPV